jgi:hypothetical protein
VGSVVAAGVVVASASVAFGVGALVERSCAGYWLQYLQRPCWCFAAVRPAAAVVAAGRVAAEAAVGEAAAVE